MTQAVAKYAAKKVMNREMNKYKQKSTVTWDPYYEEIPHPRKPGKTKKVKRQIPDYIDPADAEILAWARRHAYKLDCCLFNFMGVRFGWSSVIGIIPAFGDALDALLAIIFILKVRKVSCGLDNEFWMWMNVLGDFVIGLIPLVGDLLDAYMRCNSRNVRLLERCLDKAYKPDNVNTPEPATVYADFSDDDDSKRGVSPPGYDRRDTGTAAPQPARTPDARRGEAPQRSRGLGLFGGRTRTPDLESGIIRNDGREERRR